MTDAIYVRVSSRTQSERSQLPDLERWAKAQDAPPAWYRDSFTGKTLARPGWERLWADVLACKVDRVVIWRLDRLGRTLSGLATLFDELRARRVTLVSLREGFDLETPAGRMLAGVLASAAQYETELRSERQMAGIEQAKAKGIRFGRKAVGEGNGKPIKVTDEKRDLVLRLYAERAPVARISRLASLSRTTVYKILDQRSTEHS